MEECKHQFGLKTRDSGEQYCPVCRKTMYGFQDMIEDWPKKEDKSESTGQGRSNLIGQNGWRRVGSGSGEGFERH